MFDRKIFHKTLTLAKAVLTGKDVGEDRLRKRLEVCAACPLVARQGDLMKCSICGCQVSEAKLINLARYEETKDYGCKAEGGSKWQKAGC